MGNMGPVCTNPALVRRGLRNCFGPMQPHSLISEAHAPCGESISKGANQLSLVACEGEQSGAADSCWEAARAQCH